MGGLRGGAGVEGEGRGIGWAKEEEEEQESSVVADRQLEGRGPRDHRRR